MRLRALAIAALSLVLTAAPACREAEEAPADVARELDAVRGEYARVRPLAPDLVRVALATTLARVTACAARAAYPPLSVVREAPSGLLQQVAARGQLSCDGLRRAEAHARAVLGATLEHSAPPADLYLFAFAAAGEQDVEPVRIGPLPGLGACEEIAQLFRLAGVEPVGCDAWEPPEA